MPQTLFVVLQSDAQVVQSSPCAGLHIASPQTGSGASQSLSFAAVQPLGQQPSLFVHALIGGYEHIELHMAALPVSTSRVQALPSLQLLGQVPMGSHVSPDSTTPFPHDGEQSLSEVALHPAGQHPSPPTHIVIATELHAALQLAALPVSVSVVHALPSSQLVGQLPGGSHVSSGSMTPLPQLGEQSLSEPLLQALGQQPSSSAQASIGVDSHAAVHSAALPMSASTVHALPSSQPVGQFPGGSQVSPSSTTSFPQNGPPSSTLPSAVPPSRLRGSPFSSVRMPPQPEIHVAQTRNTVHVASAKSWLNRCATESSPIEGNPL